MVVGLDQFFYRSTIKNSKDLTSENSEEILYLRKNYWLQTEMLTIGMDTDNKTNTDSLWNCTFEVTREQLTSILEKSKEVVRTRNSNLVEEYFDYFICTHEEFEQVIEEMKYFNRKISSYLRNTKTDYCFYYNSSW